MSKQDALTERIRHETRELSERVRWLEGVVTGMRSVIETHTETLEQMAETMRLLAQKVVSGGSND